MLVFYYPIIASVLVGIFFYRQYPLYLKLFIPFLVITLLVEMAVAFHWFHFEGSNLWLYNVFTVLEFCFYFFIFFLNLKEKRAKQTALFSGPIFFVLAAINIFFIQGTDHFHTITYRIASVALAIYCFLFFRQLLQVDTETNVLRNPMFWIATGLLFFYSGFFFYFCAYDYVAFTKVPLNLQLWKIISRSLNILLYGFFFITFLCNLKPLKF